jgi:D-arabinose 1-dehydrogenase-like Zn-dependent alcohol dehydrogenase
MLSDISGLGQLGIQYAKAMGAKVIGIDIDDDTLATAKASGATETFNSRSNKDFIAKISALTNGGCSDVVVYTAVKAGYDVAPKLVRIGGNFVVVGVTSDDIHLSTLDLTMSRYRLVTANNAATPPLLRECAEFTAEHGISSPSKFFKLDQIGEMIEIMNKEKMAGARLAVKF